MTLDTTKEKLYFPG